MRFSPDLPATSCDGDVARIGIAELEKRIARGDRRTAVVTDLCETWPAMKSWTRERLERWVPDVSLGAASIRIALAGCALGPAGDLLADVPLPSFVSPKRVRQVNVWRAPEGAVSNLHFDLMDNVLGILRGSKDVVIFEPTETRRLYSHFPLDLEEHPTNSKVDLMRVDGDRFPRLRRARHRITTVRAGEALYMRVGVWHHVVSHAEESRPEEGCLAANIWFVPRLSLVERARYISWRVRVRAMAERLANLASRGQRSSRHVP